MWEYNNDKLKVWEVWERTIGKLLSIIGSALRLTNPHMLISSSVGDATNVSRLKDILCSLITQVFNSSS